MAFKASNAIPAERYQRAKNLAWQLRQQAISRSANFASGANAAEILAAADNLKAFREGLLQAAATPGIAVYAQAQEDDPTYDVAAEFSAMISAVESAITNIVTSIPKDGDGYLLINEINPDGSLTPRQFSGAALAGVISSLDAIAAAVE